MDTLTSSVSAFPLPGLHESSRNLFSHLLRIKTASNQPTDATTNPHYFLSTTSDRRRNSTSILKEPISPTLKNRRLSTSTYTKQDTIFHKKAASGYAAALIDMARCNNILELVEKDVRRFSRLLRQKEVRAVLEGVDVDEDEKGEILKEVAVKGKFHKYLVVILKVIIEKNRVAILGEVFQEFQRIYDELVNTQFVLVSSGRKMEKEEMAKVAKRVQKLSGATMVAKRVQKLSGATMVKVRQLVNEKLALPPFAL